MIELLDIAPVVQQIKDHSPEFSGRVYEAVLSKEFEIEREQSPSAFVYYSSDKSMENQTLMQIRQQMFCFITVAIVVRRSASRTDQFGQTDNQLIRQLRKSVFNAIIGFEYANTAAFEHVNGELNNKGVKTLDWRDQFMTHLYITD
jgi:hypothetical protein